MAHARQLGGKELSYNNIQDANAALNIVREFDEPFCVALKHMNPCGAGIGENLLQAWTRAYEADKVSIYGGIVAMNRPLTAEVAALMKPIFLEIVMAPAFEPEALEVLASKKNLRLLEVKMDNVKACQKQYVGVNGGLLVQDADIECKDITPDMCVTERKPTEKELSETRLRMEDCEACEEQRHRGGERRSDSRCRRRTDESCRLCRNRT